MSSELAAVEKANMLYKLHDGQLFSSRFNDSSEEIGKSISSWHQLAEEVFLNVATLTHASRRILMGDEEIVSGRFSIMMSTIFTPKNRISTSTSEETPLK